MKLKNINYLVIILTVFIFSGCASKPKITRSGFLNDYTNLRPSEIVKGLLVEKHPSKHIGQYQKFIVDFPVVYFQANEEGTAVDPAALNKIAETFRAKAIEALEVKYEVVDEPAEGVLRIRTAITDVVANKVYFNLHWSTTATGLGLGGASIEADFVDSTTNERIMAIVDAKRGKKLKYSKGLTKWGHTNDVLNQWVELFVNRLEELNLSDYQDQMPGE